MDEGDEVVTINAKDLSDTIATVLVYAVHTLEAEEDRADAHLVTLANRFDHFSRNTTDPRQKKLLGALARALMSSERTTY